MKYSAAKIHVLIEEAGLDDEAVQEVLINANLVQLDLMNADRTFSFDQVMIVFRSILEKSFDKELAFRAGRRFRLSHLGILGFALMSQPDLRTALKFTLKYRALSSPMIGLKVDSDEDACRLVFFPFSGDIDNGPSYSRVLDFNFGLFMALIEDGLGHNNAFLRIHLSNCADDITRSALQNNGFAIVESHQDAIELDTKILDEPLRQNSLVGAAVARKLCDEAMAKTPSLSTFTNEVRACLVANVEKPVTASYIAAILGKSERSFRRQLSAEDMGFRDLKHDVQVALARQYLEQTQMTVKDISLATGFSDVANFRRLFRRLQGVNPSDYRKQPRTVV